MPRNQQASKYNKYYHNDIKKQLGIDESRSASQKLLDQVIKVQKRVDYYAQNYFDTNQLKSQPKKKVKLSTQNGENQKPLTNLQILQTKLFKNIQNQLNITKLLKSLTILRKCLNQQTFLHDPQINFNQNWKIYSRKLINQITQRNYCSGESMNIMESIGDCLQIIYTKFESTKINQIKSNGQINSNTPKQQTIFSYEQIYANFCKLFTDDSFIFNKNVANIKKFIFSQFEQENQSLKEKNQQPEQQKQPKENNKSLQSNKVIALNLLVKLVNIPIKFDWAHSSLSNFFRQFNNRGFHDNFQSEQERKSYLKKYNQFLTKKPKTSGDRGSINIMGNSASTIGVKIVQISNTNEENADKWVTKQ